MHSQRIFGERRKRFHKRAAVAVFISSQVKAAIERSISAHAQNMPICARMQRQHRPYAGK